MLVDASHAVIFGRGSVSGGPPQLFRVDVSHTAAGDTFTIQWAGYAVGGPVVKGKIEIEPESCGRAMRSTTARRGQRLDKEGSV